MKLRIKLFQIHITNMKKLVVSTQSNLEPGEFDSHFFRFIFYNPFRLTE